MTAGENGDGVCGTDKCSNQNNPEKRIFMPLSLWVSDDHSRCVQGWEMQAPAVKDCNNEKHLMS